jgi:hypothetical protein
LKRLTNAQTCLCCSAAPQFPIAFLFNPEHPVIPSEAEFCDFCDFLRQNKMLFGQIEFLHEVGGRAFANPAGL